jgi:hypothetical protein
MGLAKTLQNAGTTIVKALGDIAVPISYHSIVFGTYDPTLDREINTEIVIPLKGILYKSQEKVEDAKKTVLEQTKVLIAGQAFGLIIPKETDYMMINGVKYEIKNVNSAPVEAVYVFIVRIV